MEALKWSLAFLLLFVFENFVTYGFDSGPVHLQRTRGLGRINENVLCNQDQIRIANGTLEGSFVLTLRNGTVLRRNVTLELNNINPNARVSFNQTIVNGDPLRCRFRRIEFGPSNFTLRIDFNNCFLNTACYSRNRFPLASELQDLDRLCPTPSFQPVGPRQC